MWMAMRLGRKHPAINLTGLFPNRQEVDSFGESRQDWGVLVQDQGVSPPVLHLIWDETEWERVKRDGTSFLRGRSKRPDEDEEIEEFLALKPTIGNP